MALNLGLLIFSFIVTSILIVPFINLLYKLRFTRRVEAAKAKGVKQAVFDKLHDWKAGTPVGAGILIVGAVAVLFGVIFPFISYIGVFVSASYSVFEEINILFFTFFSFAFLGLYDDFVKLFGKPEPGKIGMWVGLRRKHKFALQWILAIVIAILIYNNLKIDIVNIPFVEKVIHFGPWYIPFAALTIVAFVNAVNITDGLDGLAGGLLLICLFALWIIAAAAFDTPLSVFISLWIGALIAFLYFNIWPARIFMGDSGALAFGATLAVIGLLTGKIFALVIIGGVFVLEALSSLVQILSWKILKRPLLPMAPVHLWLQLIGWEEPKIVMRAWLAGLILAIFGLWMAVI